MHGYLSLVRFASAENTICATQVASPPTNYINLIFAKEIFRGDFNPPADGVADVKASRVVYAPSPQQFWLLGENYRTALRRVYNTY